MRPPRLVALAFALPLATAVPAQAVAATLQPKLPDLTGIVKDPKWAVVLGKALFWDVSVGSDGMSCASCHFHAGADARIKNALSPGLIELPDPDTAFDPTASGGTVDSTYTLDDDDFPFHQLADLLNRNSALDFTTNDVVSSAGAVDATFTRIRLRGPFDSCDEVNGDVFHAGAFAARQVEPRNTPTMINAVFNHRNFWDGRAMNDFSGVGVFGQADVLNNPAKRLVVLQNGSLQLTSLNLPDSSLASQAVGPPLSNLEMSCGERAFPNIGRKLFGVLDRALSLQKVHAQDSVFGAPGPFGDLRGALPRGLAITHNYRNLVQRAFENKWWSAPGRFRITDAGVLVPAPVLGFTQMELNFSMIWGIAIMLYEATLISDDSPFDRGELSAAAQHGLTLFNNAPPVGAACRFCHVLPLGSQAAQLATDPPFTTIQTVSRPNGLLDSAGNPVSTNALRDIGFFPLGVRPVAEDVGAGGTDPYGDPLSFSRKSIEAHTNPGGVTRTIVDGSFKAPQLRNVALTPPYFHNGGFSDLHQVLDFYRRGGNRRDASLTQPEATGDDSGTGLNGDDLIPVPGPNKGTNSAGTLNPLPLITDSDANDIIEFLKALTDVRVQCDRAPFDHPELPIPVGHNPVDQNHDSRADDIVFRLPEVGKSGYSPGSGLCVPNAGDLFAEGMQARIGGPPAPPVP